MPIDDVKVHGSAVVWLTSEERGGGQAGGDPGGNLLRVTPHITMWRIFA
jgi:hypothetical protein